MMYVQVLLIFGQTFSAVIMMYSNMHCCDVIVAQLAMNMLCAHYPVFLYSMRREIIYLFQTWVYISMPNMGTYCNVFMGCIMVVGIATSTSFHRVG